MTIQAWILTIAFVLVAIFSGCDEPDPNRRDSQSTAGSNPTTACPLLATCCAQLAEDAQADCQAIVARADAAVCLQRSAMFCAGPTAPPGDACVQLEACCAALEDEEDAEECEEAVEEGDLAVCTEAFADFCQSPGPTNPPSGPDACALLEVCCAELEDEDDAEECEEAVEDGDLAACTEAVADFCQSAGAANPPVRPDACAQLAPCCAGLADEEDAEECAEAVEKGDAVACAEILPPCCTALGPAAPAPVGPSVQPTPAPAQPDDDDDD